jgi:hypothetical protein
MVNNLELIKTLLDFTSDDDFYFVQIIQRKKDNPETRWTNNSARIVKAYYIRSVEQLDKQFSEMKLLADTYNARVGINLNKRSFERTALHMLKKVTDQILNKDFASVRRAYNSVCGEYSIGDRIWLIDVDNIDGVPVEDTPLIEFITCQQPEGDKVLGKIPTKNGYHLITKPFNTILWRMSYEHQIHKNNPTILYIP